MFSRKVVGWSIDDNMRADLIIKAFENAWGGRQPGDGLVVHSDCGGQYKALKFRRMLWRRKIRQSMTNRGSCYDNAMAESFFGILKKDLIRGKVFSSLRRQKLPFSSISKSPQSMEAPFLLGISATGRIRRGSCLTGLRFFRATPVDLTCGYRLARLI